MNGIASLGAATAASGSSTAPPPRLVKAAHEFEAQMMKELMKPMTSSSSLPGSEDEDSGSGGALTEFASEALGKALSEGGGFGIARQIVHDLSQAGNRNGKVPVTGNLNFNTVIKAAK